MKKSELVVKETIHPLAVQQEQYMGLIQMAVEKGADITQLEKLMDLQERYEANQAKKDFNLSMSRFQSLLPIIEKNGVVDYTTAKGRTYYEYAKLEDIAHAIKPALKESQLSYRFTQKQSDGLIKVICIVTHSSGHFETSELTSQADFSGGKDHLKAIASALRYLRRYTLTDSLGIVVGGEDDDGDNASNETTTEIEPKEKVISGYSQDDFDKNYPKWMKLIDTNKKTADQIIAMISTKAELTEDQIKTIKGEL